MQDTYQAFYVGVNILAAREGRLLLGKRKNSYGAGTWGLPDGHLEPGEGMKDAAVRELAEETGLSADSLEFSNIVNDRSRGQNRLQVGFIAQGIEGEPALKEPDRCDEWRWFGLNELPSELFPPHVRQIKNFLDGSNFADA